MLSITIRSSIRGNSRLSNCRTLDAEAMVGRNIGVVSFFFEKIVFLADALTTDKRGKPSCVSARPRSAA
jgi:hypothetical protein